jgi:hypothetical protein
MNDLGIVHFYEAYLSGHVRRSPLEIDSGEERSTSVLPKLGTYRTCQPS